MAKKSENTVKAKSIFQHLSGIKEKKESWASLSDMDKKSFSPFIMSLNTYHANFLVIINEYLENDQLV